MSNEVEITITGKDLSGPAFDSSMAKMAALRAEAAALAKTFGDIGNIDIKTNEATASLIALRSKMQALGIADIADVNVQPGRIMTQMELLKRLIGQAGISDLLDVNVNTERLTSQLAKIGSLRENIPVNFDVGRLPQLPTSISSHFNLGVSDSGLITANSLLDDLRSRADLAATAVNNLTSAETRGSAEATAMATAVSALATAQARDDVATQQSLTTTQQSIAILVQAAAAAAQAGNARDAARLAYAAQTAATVTNNQITKDNVDVTNAASFATRLMTNAILAGIPMYDAGGRGWRVLTGGVHLFGGAIEQLIPKMPVWISHLIAFTANWHLLAEAIIETAGTLIPAAIAFGVFAAASIPTFKDLFAQLKNVYQANQALGESVRPLTGAFQQMADAVRPEVYVLAGEAFYIMGKNTGVFQSIAVGAGKVLDDLGARFAYAITQGGAFSTIASHAAASLNIWGTGIGNIGGIIGNILKVLPGYAVIIGNAFDAVSHAIETITGSALGQWFLSVGLAAHGALVYIGLLATAFAILATRGLASLATLLLNVALGLERIGAAGAATAMLKFAGAAETAAALPWGWIGVAAAALGFFIFRLVTAKDGIQQFFAQVQNNLQNTPLSNLGALLSSNIDKTAGALSIANVQLDQFVKANQAGVSATAWLSHPTASQGALQNEYHQLTNNANDYAAGLKMLQGDQQTVNQHIQEAAGIFGGTANAWAVLNAAGVTSAQMLDANKQHWAEALIEAQAFNDTLLIGTGGSARYTAALNAMNFQSGDTKNALGQVTTAMQALTQAEDSVTNTLIGGEQAFNNFQQTMFQMAKDSKVADSALGGVSQAAIQVAYDFYNQSIPAAQKMIDALNSQDINTSNLTKVVATMATQLLGFAGNNEAARIAVVDLINNALGPGTVSLQNLNTWVGHNSTSLQGFDSIVGQTMASASNLAGVLQQDLNVQFQNALLQSSGATAQIKIFAASIANTGNASASTAAARAQLIKDLENSGFSAQQATNYVNGLQRQINSMHGTNLDFGISGSGYVTITGSDGKTYQISAGGAASPHAMGGYIGGTGGPTADDKIIAVSTGEYVVQASSVSRYGVGMLDAINAGRYAGGGFVGDSQLLVAPGQVQSAGGVAVSQALLTAGEVALQAAIAAAKAAAAAAAAAASAGSGGGNPGQNQSLAKSLMPSWSSGANWSAWLNLWNRESGWSQFADTRKSGLDPANASVFAYGIPQARPYSKMPQAGWPSDKGGSSNPHAQETWGIGYIQGQYGNPINAWAHEQSQGWYAKGGKVSSASMGVYDDGGWLKPGWTMAYNGTGKPEPVGRVTGPHYGGPMQFEVTSGGSSAFEKFMVEAIREWVRIKGGGDVQRAFGRN